MERTLLFAGAKGSGNVRIQEKQIGQKRKKKEEEQQASGKEKGAAHRKNSMSWRGTSNLVR